MILEYRDYRSYLKQELANRISRNPSYSLRAFARQLGIHHSMLVQVFQNKKRLSVDRAHQLSRRLELGQDEREYFCLLVEVENAKTPQTREVALRRLSEAFPNAEIRDLSVEHFQMISEWYHLPLLQMVEMTDFDFNPANIAKRLSITKVEAELAVERLEKLELIQKDAEGQYRKTDSRLLATSAVPQDALRKYHRQMLSKAAESIENQTPKEKWIGSETFAFDPELMPEADRIVEKFFDRMVELATQGKNRTQIYHLNTCFFRLTETKEKTSA